MIQCSKCFYNPSHRGKCPKTGYEVVNDELMVECAFYKLNYDGLVEDRDKYKRLLNQAKKILEERLEKHIELKRQYYHLHELCDKYFGDGGDKVELSKEIITALDDDNYIQDV